MLFVLLSLDMDFVFLITTFKTTIPRFPDEVSAFIIIQLCFELL